MCRYLEEKCLDVRTSRTWAISFSVNKGLDFTSATATFFKDLSPRSALVAHGITDLAAIFIANTASPLR